MTATAIQADPTVQRAAARLDQLRARRAALEEELREARQAEQPTVEDLAGAAFRGEDVTTTAHRDPADIARELEGVRLALKRATDTARNERSAAKTRAVEAARPRYARVQRLLAVRVRELLEAHEDERAIVRELEEAGVETLARVHDFNPLPVRPLQAWLEKAERLTR